MIWPILAVDVGNSRMKFGLFDAENIRTGQLPACLRSTACHLNEALPWPAIREWVASGGPVAGVVAGANPSGIRRVLETWPIVEWPAPIVIERPFESVLKVNLAEPEKVGVDRLLNAVAANAVRTHNRPAVIVSAGTATTVDYVDVEGAFAGGAILPGFELSARALHQYTALLPLISMDELDVEGRDPLGLNTRHALCSGLFWGQLGAIRELVAQFSAFAPVAPELYLTGGGADLLARKLPSARREPHLALQGLAIALVAQSCDEQYRDCRR